MSGRETGGGGDGEARYKSARRSGFKAGGKKIVLSSIYPYDNSVR